jgi:UDP-N-acetyl-D-glucosamine dehydrogenase
MKQIAIVGLGYVGLPLALQFARSGVKVLGLDIDSNKIDKIHSGKTYMMHVPADDIAMQVNIGNLEASTDFSRVSEVDSVILCVPTPLNSFREPDLSYVLDTGRSIAPYMKQGSLIVLESTTYPGTTDGELLEVLEKVSGKKAGVDFHLAFSPEREDPGNPDSKVSTIPKVVGGLTPECLEKAMQLYGLAIDKLIPVSSCRVSEATKLLENIFRSINIALVNELKIVYGAMGIDIWEVIEAAKTKPFGFMPFYPGPGLGGHCIPIDPVYLTWKAKEFGQHTRFIELASEINTAMPDYVVKMAIMALNVEGKSMKGSRILILGLAYKANVDDDRESPSYKLMEKFEALGAQVFYHDPYIPVIPMTREHAMYAGRKSVEQVTDDYDLIVLSTDHNAYRKYDFSSYLAPLVDTRNTVSIGFRPTSYFKA